MTEEISPSSSQTIVMQLGAINSQLSLMDSKVAAIDKGLAVNTTKTEGIEAHLNKLNGSVAKQAQDINGLDHDRIQMLSHISRLLEKQNDLDREQLAVQQELNNAHIQAQLQTQADSRNKTESYKKALIVLAKWLAVGLAILFYNLLLRSNILAKLEKPPL